MGFEDIFSHNMWMDYVKKLVKTYFDAEDRSFWCV